MACTDPQSDSEDFQPLDGEDAPTQDTNAVEVDLDDEEGLSDNDDDADDSGLDSDDNADDDP